MRHAGSDCGMWSEMNSSTASASFEPSRVLEIAVPFQLPDREAVDLDGDLDQALAPAPAVLTDTCRNFARRLAGYYTICNSVTHRSPAVKQRYSSTFSGSCSIGRSSSVWPGP